MRPDLVCEKNVLVNLVRIVGNPEMMRKHFSENFNTRTKDIEKKCSLHVLFLYGCQIQGWVHSTNYRTELQIEIDFGIIRMSC